MHHELAREIAAQMATGGDVWDSDVERINAGIEAGYKLAMDKLRDLPDDVAQRIGTGMLEDSVSANNGGWVAYARRVATALVDAIEVKP